MPQAHRSRTPNCPRGSAHVVKWALTFVATLTCPVALAHSEGYAVDVEVYDRSEQRVLPVYEKDGQRWIVGTPGHDYSLRLRNRTGRRLLTVGSVDGVNIVTGETASPSQSGYVLGAHGYLEVGGWRKDLSRTASFYFTSLPDAYATRTGRPDNVGVIGIAVFRERPVPIAESRAPSYADPPYRDEARRAAGPPATLSAPAAPGAASADPGVVRERAESAPAPRAAPSLGTGHGRIEDSPAQRTAFTRDSSTPAEVITIRYDRLENLVAMGIVPQPHVARWADPFPRWRSGFVPDPPR